MRIRLAETKDAEELCDIYNYEILNSTATFSTEPQTVKERMEWLLAHNKDNHPLIVAEEAGRTAGYACLSNYRPHDAYARTVELSVYVDRHFRGHRTGEALMREILNMARKDPDIHSVISVITADNEVSIRLHEKFGFTYCGTVREAGQKFGKWLDIVQYQLLV